MKFSLPKLPEYSQRWLLLDLLGGIVGVIGEAATKNIMVVYPDETVHVAKDMIYENKIGCLPVVSRDNPKKMVGIISRTDIIHA